MAKFKTNYRSEGRRGKGAGYLFRILMFGIILVASIFILHRFLSDTFSDETSALQYEIPEAGDSQERFYLPQSKRGAIVHHKYYSLSYVEKYEQAEWVAYELTRKSIKAPNVPRADRYIPDYDVSTRSAFHRDYTNSGFTRGHLAPAGDMAFNETAMKESFFMSNMSPQLREFNNGIWRELEEQTRDWAFKENVLYVTTGPVLKDIGKFIGQNRVGVPKHFYKVLLDLSGKEKKGIGFIIPHERSDEHLHEFAVSIDEVEVLTGIDFFGDLMTEELEQQLESTFDSRKWKVSKNRFNARVEKWNYQ